MLPGKAFVGSRLTTLYQQDQIPKMAVTLRSNSILDPKDQRKIPVINAVVTETDLRTEENEKRVTFLSLYPMLFPLQWIAVMCS